MIINNFFKTLIFLLYEYCIYISSCISSIFSIIGNHAHRKIYHEQLNALSYNKRNIVNKTWNTKINNNIDV